MCITPGAAPAASSGKPFEPSKAAHTFAAKITLNNARIETVFAFPAAAAAARRRKNGQEHWLHSQSFKYLSRRLKEVAWPEVC